MDPLSHYMLGWLLGRRLGLQGGLLKSFLILTLMPDFDMVSIVLGVNVAGSFHGTLTHSIFLALPVALAASIGLASIFKMGYGESIRYGVFAVGTHIFLDLFNFNLDLVKGRFLWPVFSNTLFLGEVFGYPLQYAVALHQVIFVSFVLVALYNVGKNVHPWDVWFSKWSAQ